MADLVECRSGHTYAQRPVAVTWDGERLEIEALVAEWQTPHGKGFRVQAGKGRVFELLYDMDVDDWEVREI